MVRPFQKCVRTSLSRTAFNGYGDSRHRSCIAEAHLGPDGRVLRLAELPRLGSRRGFALRSPHIVRLERLRPETSARTVIPAARRRQDPSYVHVSETVHEAGPKDASFWRTAASGRLASGVDGSGRAELRCHVRSLGAHFTCCSQRRY
ncbi:hypothetical protein C8T65DRAFT_211168 [Cerioporus squamosus]|nr:hypothetical protein C8T65DRAFT_211168 [Cerioporus squamosus]